MTRMLLSVGATLALFLAPALSASEVVSARVIRPSTPIACSKTSGVGALSSSDTLVQIAQLYPTGWHTIAFGDTDHDGRNEAVFYWRDLNWEWHYLILEEQGSNVYSQEYVGPPLIPWAIGDLDQDGKVEIIGQQSYYVHVYESADATSYPTEVVWTSPALSNVEGFTTIGDTDRDGKMEIIHSVNFGGALYIFENSGDNNYALVFSAPTPGSQDDGEKVIADLDGDGLVEIAFCGHRGQLHVYESPADNTWIETFSDTTGLLNANGAEGGVDTDGNSIPELFIAGDRYADYQKTTLVYEAIGDNQFSRVATLLLPGDFSAGGATNAMGDLDGTGRTAYVFDGIFGLSVFVASQVGMWNVWSEITDPGSGAHTGVQCFDVNGNGKSELFWDSFVSPVIVMEHPPRTSDSGPLDAARLQPLRLLPNPLRRIGIIVAPASAMDAERLTIYDVKGRLVESLSLAPGHGSHAWDAGQLSAGVYYLQLENRRGLPLAIGRGIVIR